jgi:hypothetical protein
MQRTTRNIDSPNTESLFYMLQTMRPAGSKTEESFIKRWIQPLGAEPDGYGNQVIRIGDSPVMYSSHTDTVHRDEGSQKIKHSGGWISLHHKERVASCLGADCTAGLWLMREMVLANVPGLYVFHREEEIGGYGSQWIAENNPGLLEGIVACIALDRKGINSVITHQYGGRCASDSFATSMAKQFKGYKADDSGSFTDSANYTHLVPECTNLSIGYEDAHTEKERLNLFHLIEMREQLIRFDISRVNIRREPTPKLALPKGTHGAWNVWDERESQWDRRDNRAARNVTEFCRLYPDEVADLLGQYGIGLSDLYDSTPWLE